MAGLLALLCASPAPAATVSSERPLLFAFNGEDTTAGRFFGDNAYHGVNALAVDYATGYVYVVDGGNEVIDRFDADGKAVSFTAGAAAGSSSLRGPSATETFQSQERYFFGGISGLAVDNSGGAGKAGEGEQGRVYVGGGKGPIDAFRPDGEFLWSLPGSAVKEPCGLAVDREGHLWVTGGNDEEVHEFANTGSPPAEIEKFKVSAGVRAPCGIGVDRSGIDRYVALVWNGVGGVGTLKFVGSTLDSTLTTTPTRAVTVDQSRPEGHIFTVQDPMVASQGGYQDLESRLVEYEPCSLLGCGGTLLGSFGRDLLGDGRGVAYNPVLDRVYVSDLYAERIAVFGPEASGIAPDVTAGQASGVGRNEATVNGTIDPLGLANSYHFEYKPLVDEVQQVKVNAKGGKFRLSFKGKTTGYLSYKATGAEVQAALEGLPGIGSGNVSVSGGREFYPGTEELRELAIYKVTFIGALQATNVEALEGDGSELTGGTSQQGVYIDTPVQGLGSWASALSAPARPYPGIVPADSSEHAVSAKLSGLRANSGYVVRLVGTNTEPGKDLSSYSQGVVFTTLSPPAPTVTVDSISKTTSTAHVEATVDPQEDQTTWRVLRAADPDASRTDCEALAESAFRLVKEGTIPSETHGTVKIEADISGLLAGETSCVRVLATDSGGTGRDDEAFRTVAVPPSEVETAFTAPRTDTTATVNGYVNPQGDAPFSYRFEMSTDGVNWTARPERESNVNGRQPVIVGDELSGLTPGTTYHYRLASAENEAGVTPGTGERTFTTRTTVEAQGPVGPPDCPNEEVREAQHAAYLGDCRGIELVNQPDKGNQNVIAHIGSKEQAALSVDGQAALWTVQTSAPGSNTPVSDPFLAQRTGQTASVANGWVSKSLVPPIAQQYGGGGYEYQLLDATPDLSRFALQALGGTLFEVSEASTALVRIGGEQAQEVLATYPKKGLAGGSVAIGGNGAHVVALNDESGQLEDVGQPGKPVVLSMMPSGRLAECHEIRFLGGASFRHGYAWMDSANASRVYFLSPANGDCKGPLGLYERDVETGHTTLIDPGVAGEDIGFVRATLDGRSAYFLTTDDYRRYNEKNPAKSEIETADANGHVDVYRWDEATGKSTCVTCVVSDADLQKSATSTEPVAVAVSDDFSHVYFTSSAQLVAGRGRAGAPNMYVVSEGRLGFVADPGDGYDTSVGRAELSADGSVLVFTAEAALGLTADRVAPACWSDAGGAMAPCEELYRYDARDGSIECVSCAHGALTTSTWQSENRGSAQLGIDREFALSSDGSTIVFPTAQALVPQDVNNGSDIYEWHDGAVHLITNGVSSPVKGAPMVVAGMDPNGANILFTADVPGLTGFEQDGLLNLYDARVDGGFMPPVPPEACVEDACQGPVLAAPAAALPGSALLFATDGNVSVQGRAAAKVGSKRKPACERGRARKRARARRSGCAGQKHGKGRHGVRRKK